MGLSIFSFAPAWYFVHFNHGTRSISARLLWPSLARTSFSHIYIYSLIPLLISFFYLTSFLLALSFHSTGLLIDGIPRYIFICVFPPDLASLVSINQSMVCSARFILWPTRQKRNKSYISSPSLQCFLCFVILAPLDFVLYLSLRFSHCASSYLHQLRRCLASSTCIFFSIPKISPSWFDHHTDLIRNVLL